MLELIVGLHLHTLRASSAATSAPAGPLYRRRRRAQPGDQRQDVGERQSWHRDFGHLEGHVSAMADDLRPDLDQLLLEAGQRPRLRCLWYRQRPHEVPRRRWLLTAYCG